MSGSTGGVGTLLGRAAARVGEIAFLRRLAKEAGCRLLLRRRYVAIRRGNEEIRISRANSVYAQDLIRDFRYYFDVVAPRREGKLEVVDYSRPALHAMRTDGLPFWFPELAESMETTSLYLARAGLGPGQTVLDLGAYAGGATYHFSRAVGREGRVLAFEPDPKSFDCLVRNIALHGLYNVSAFRLGVWSASGRVLFQAEGSMGSAVVEASARASDSREWIDVVSLADLCSRVELPRVDFMKLDVEGSEGPILEAAAGFIRRYRPRMIVEVHWVKGARSDRAVTEALSALGYSVEVLDQAGLALPLLFARPD
jgi:FkbM family methyltransferase